MRSKLRPLTFSAVAAIPLAAAVALPAGAGAQAPYAPLPNPNVPVLADFSTNVLDAWPAVKFSKVLSGKRATMPILVTAPGDYGVAVRYKPSKKPTRTIASGDVTAVAGQTSTTVKLRRTSAGKKLLKTVKQKKSISVRIVTSYTDLSGAMISSTVTGKFKR
jgi:hypothetical protein